ncbi:MAG: cation-translocating P-type ATPase [Acidimicrobiia bacterium]
MDAVVSTIDPLESSARLLRDLRSSAAGLTQREADRRLVVVGPNRLERRTRRRWWRALLGQFTHPLALLLSLAAVLAVVSGSALLAGAIALVIGINAVFAFWQEQQAERAVELLAQLLPSRATVIRDGIPRAVDVAELVPGDILAIKEGDRVCADARLLSGSLEVDCSALTGESVPVVRVPGEADRGVPLLHAQDLVFSGATCVAGAARAVVFATGMRSELGRIAALTERVHQERSPLEREVRRVAMLIAVVAVVIGVAFLPLGMLAGLPFGDAAIFAVGLIVANVPEGLLPTITLALALGVRVLARQGALVKRLSAVETLGSTAVICTDKTGTLTENRMHVVTVLTPSGSYPVDRANTPEIVRADSDLVRIAQVALACTAIDVSAVRAGNGVGDPTELAIVRLGLAIQTASSAPTVVEQRAVFAFDPVLRVMSTIDWVGGQCWVHMKGAPEEVLARCSMVGDARGTQRVLNAVEREQLLERINQEAAQGMRMLAFAARPTTAVPTSRALAEQDLCFLGVVALLDPPRPEVPAAVVQCRAAGIRILVVTGDHPLTARAIAARIGIGAGSELGVVLGDDLDRMTEDALDALLDVPGPVLFARTSPEAKLRIVDAVRSRGDVVAVTGDGVNDAPALRRADIGVAMGRSGTEVAREAATMVLTDDNFATVVTAIREGRRAYANVRKFMFYIFAHATPEAVPFLVFALSGGRIPLPLTVLAILAIDLGTETFPALALAREPLEPGVMQEPPRARRRGIVSLGMLLRAWAFVGAISAALSVGAFLVVLTSAGWHPGAPIGPGTPLHRAYLEATSVTFLAIVLCQVGTAVAARTERVALRAIGIWSNPMLWWAIVFECAFAAALVYLPPLQALFRTAAVGPRVLIAMLPFPFVVWGADELRRAIVRRRRTAFIASQPGGDRVD